MNVGLSNSHLVFFLLYKMSSMKNVPALLRQMGWGRRFLQKVTVFLLLVLAGLLVVVYLIRLALGSDIRTDTQVHVELWLHGDSHQVIWNDIRV